MRLGSLQLVDWRCFAAAELDLTGDFVVFWGPNGGGKTNLLEAISVATTGKGFRTASWGEVIRWGQKQATLSCRLEAENTEGKSRAARWIRMVVEPGERRIHLDGTPLKDIAMLTNHVWSVSFTPQDRELVQGFPEGRRHFLDRAAFGLWRDHLDSVRRLRRVFFQKNALLRRMVVEGRRRPLEVTVWNEQLVDAGVAVARRRLAVVEELRPFFQRSLATLSPSLKVRLSYQSQLGNDPSTMKSAFQQALERWGPRSSLYRGQCLVGPQRDDLSIEVLPRKQKEGSTESQDDSHLARKVASQGQTRAISLCLRLSEYLASEHAGTPPILLLDDLSSELDVGTVQNLMSLLSSLKTQIFITTTDPGAIARFRDKPIKLIRVVEGGLPSGAGTVDAKAPPG